MFGEVPHFGSCGVCLRERERERERGFRSRVETVVHEEEKAASKWE